MGGILACLPLDSEYSKIGLNKRVMDMLTKIVYKLSNSETLRWINHQCGLLRRNARADTNMWTCIFLELQLLTTESTMNDQTDIPSPHMAR